MEKIFFEKEACDYLNIPSIPKKAFDGKSSFKDGVAIINLSTNEQAYAICSFNSEFDKEPRVKKVFSQQPFTSIDKVFVVPAYMDTKNIENADLDETSKQAAERLAQEANELTQQEEESEIEEMKALPEWIFDEIHSQDEAEAWLRAYNSKNKIRGKIPTNPETLKMRLLNVYSQMKNK